METHLFILLIALLADWFWKEPEWLWQKIPHPVVLFGKLISVADNLLNREADSGALRYRKGALAWVMWIGITLLISGLLMLIFSLAGLAGWLAELLLLTVMLAQKSLKDHVLAVKHAMTNGNRSAVQAAIGQIVGRDPEQLDDSGTARAAIESLAENYSDGVVAPVFWYAIFGLPGLLVYKMINTADSMVGHRDAKYRDFGKVAARMDDLANWLPARLSALLFVLGAWAADGRSAARNAMACAWRDAGLHRSPNSGWPEAAMAGAGDFALGGPRFYANEIVQQAYINGSGRLALGSAEIGSAVRLFDRACFALWGAIFIAVVFL
jgi:adenosylcobinamide-phosphate synthase